MFSLGVDAASNLAVQKDSRYDTKSQFAVRGNLYFSFHTPRSYFFQAVFGYGAFTRSGAGKDWVSYRGYSSMAAGLGGGHYFRAFSLFDSLWFPGVAVRGFAEFGRYSDTDIYFFYPRAELEALLRTEKFFHDSLVFEMGLPLDWYFRRDLTVSFSLGLSMRLRFYIP